MVDRVCPQFHRQSTIGAHDLHTSYVVLLSPYTHTHKEQHHQQPTTTTLTVVSTIATTNNNKVSLPD
eukprot:4565578-Amphidinium_carterae.1